MQTPTEVGACVGIAASVSDETGRILPNVRTNRNYHDWLKAARGFRSPADWKLLYHHRARWAAYLNNVIQFPGVSS